jgi:hypothetical protein
MGGAKTVNAGKYIKPRDPARDVAVMQMMMQVQKQQQDEQAAMLSKYAQMAPQVQTFDPREISQRSAELGMANLAQQRELEKMTSPEAAAMRLSQSKQMEQLTSPENVRQYMNEYMRTQGLPSQYATGLGDSTIGRAAMYDRALAAKKAYEENLSAQQQAYLAQTEAPVGGLSPAALMAAKQAAQAQNIASGEAYKQAMLGTVGQFGQTGADVANRQFSALSRLQNAIQQSDLGRQQAMIDSSAQNAAAKNAMTGAYIQAGGQVASSAISAMGGMAGGGGGLNKAGFYGGAEQASSAYNVPTSQLSYQSPTGLGGFMGLGKQGGFYYTPAGSFGR